MKNENTLLSQTRKSNIFKTVNYILLIATSIIVIIPFFWMLSTALKTESEALHIPPLLFPAVPQFMNFIKSLFVAPFITYFTNTVIVALFVVVISTTVTVLASFAFARLEFRGKKVLFFLVLASVMVPQEMLIITNFMTIAKLGWLNTLQALILPYCVNAFNIFLLRQTMLQIPDELYVAAKIDGLGDFKYMAKVAIPMSKSTILTTMLLSLIWIWNTYAWPNLVTTMDSMRMISNGLKNAFITSAGTIQYELQMAAATIVTIPLIILFIALRKNIFSGMSKGGLKG